MVLYSANIVGAWSLIALHLFVQNLPKKLGSIDWKRKNSKNKMKANEKRKNNVQRHDLRFKTIFDPP